MASPFTTYKLIILYMLQNSDGDLTNSQITDFILDRKYTNYFQLQQAVSELVEADLVEMSSQSNRSYYRLTSEGKNTLKYFSKELSSDIKKEVEEYLNSLHCKIEEHLLTPADYYPTKRVATRYVCGSSKAASASLISASMCQILLLHSLYVKAGLINTRMFMTK